MRKSPIVQFLVSLTADWIPTRQPFNKPNIEANATAFAIRNKCEMYKIFLTTKTVYVRVANHRAYLP